MNQILEERQHLFRAALKILNITDCYLETDWNKLVGNPLTPNWEIHPILWYGTEKEILPFPPENIVKSLKETYLVIKANAKLQNLILEEILQRAWEKGIEICLLKGNWLSREYYPDIALRPTGDIDLLVKPSSKKGVDKIFRELGAIFEGSQGAHDRYMLPDANDVIVEVHFRLINKESVLQRLSFPIDFLEKIPWEEMISMPGGGLRLPIWYEYDYLHLHALREGYKSLKWIIDIALIDAGEEIGKYPVKSRFISNARTMMYNISSLLLGEISYPKHSGFLWKKSITAGARGEATRLERLLMTMACTTTFSP
jgi:hypothetical protein